MGHITILIATRKKVEEFISESSGVTRIFPPGNFDEAAPYVNKILPSIL